MIPAETMREIVDAADVTIERQRWPTVRSGERQELPWYLRLAIYRRDNFSCRICHKSDEAGTVEIDHIIPWSAGGPDTSDNLRLLCGPCNQQRSNFLDGAPLRPVRPVTWSCIECEPYIDSSAADIIAYCAECRHLSRTDAVI